MKMSDAKFELQLAAATKRGQDRQRKQPLVRAVSWDHSLGAVIDLNNGCRVCVPLALLPELRDASPRQLQNVEIMGIGQAVQWPDLDQQFGISELLADAWSGGPPKPTTVRAKRTHVGRPRNKKTTAAR